MQPTRSTLADVLSYARERDYTGWDLYDGESSALLRRLPVDNRWLNLAFQQFVRRAPVNVRPLLLVEQRRNFMGVSMFVLANTAMFELTGERQYLDDARALTAWLVEHRSDGYSGFCGGHKHPLQGLEARTGPNVPGIVGTSYAVRALLAADSHLERDYADIARTAAAFVVDDLQYHDVPDGPGARILYTPNDSGEAYTLNANALGARLLLELSQRFDDDGYRERATRILDYVAAQQTDIGGWQYMDPPSASHLSMDNFHNGFVLETFLRYADLVDDRFERTIERAATFHREHLFNADGSPNYDERQPYPRDVHAVAEGAVVFTDLGDLSFARRILDWGTTNLSDGDGAFYLEKRRCYTKRITCMRWCQATMAHALSHYLLAADERATGPSVAAGAPDAS